MVERSENAIVYRRAKRPRYLTKLYGNLTVVDPAPFPPVVVTVVLTLVTISPVTELFEAAFPVFEFVLPADELLPIPLSTYEFDDVTLPESVTNVVDTGGNEIGTGVAGVKFVGASGETVTVAFVAGDTLGIVFPTEDVDPVLQAAGKIARRAATSNLRVGTENSNVFWAFE